MLNFDRLGGEINFIIVAKSPLKSHEVCHFIIVANYLLTLLSLWLFSCRLVPAKVILAVLKVAAMNDRERTTILVEFGFFLTFADPPCTSSLLCTVLTGWVIFASLVAQA